MKTYKHIILATAIFCTSTAALPAQTGFSFLEPASAPSQSAGQSANEARQDELYRDGTQAMNEGKWEVALAKFTDAAKLQGSRSAGALYWKAHSLNKLGQRNEAITTAGEVIKRYPGSNWAKTADQLLLELGAKNPTTVVEQDPNEDLKLLALRRLCEEDEDRCVPLVRRFLENPANSARAKEKVMFILAQGNSAGAQQMVGEIARGKIYPALQVKAIQNLGINSNDENMKVLSEIYASNAEVEVKKKILDAFGIAGQRSRLLEAARNENDPELQKRAINGLGIAGGRQELLTLYKASAAAPDKRIMILNAMMISGADDALTEIATTEPDQRVRLKAIRTLGITGGKKMGPTLLTIYNSNQDEETRKAVIEALFVSGDSSQLIDLAKKEKDPKIKRRLVEKIALMGDKASRDYMIQILEQE